MQLVHTIDEVRAQVKAWKQEGLSVGLVPTMGYLHAVSYTHLDVYKRQRFRS